MKLPFLTRISRMGELPRYILTRCLVLAGLMLVGALTLVLSAGPYSPSTYHVYTLAAALRSGALVLFGAGLIGSALMEDALASRR